MKKIAFALLFSSSYILQGCAPVVIAAAGTGGGVGLAANSRPIKTFREDEKLEYQVQRTIKLNKAIYDSSHINAYVYNGNVLLIGQTPTAEFKQQAEDAARSVSGINKIYNELTVQGSTSSLVRTNDAWITTKIRSLLLKTEGIDSNRFKVITEDGTVYLLGKVSREQADKAVDVVRTIEGVQKVVRVFEYTR